MAKMKRVKLLGLLLALSIAAASVAACGPKNTNEESSLPEESSSQSSEVSSQASSESSSEVSSEVSSTVSASVSGGDTSGKPSQGQQVAPVETSDAEFNAHFKSNPIDKAYVEESNNAMSNQEIIAVCQKFSDLWQEEIKSAYKKLNALASGDALAKIQKDQKTWENGTLAEIRKINENAGGGSMGQVTAAGEIMDYYRARAAELYHLLYNYDKNYVYAYKS